MFVVVIGNPFDGLSIHGPFDSHDDARQWAEDEGDSESWWVKEVEKPT